MSPSIRTALACIAIVFASNADSFAGGIIPDSIQKKISKALLRQEEATFHPESNQGSNNSVLSAVSWALWSRNSRRLYLPAIGPSPIRVGEIDNFDRRQIIDVEAYLDALAKAREAAELALKEKLKLEKEESEQQVAQDKPNAAIEPDANKPAIEKGQDKTNTISASSRVEVVNGNGEVVSATMPNIPRGPGSAPGSDAFDPELLLRFFDNKNKQDSPAVAIKVPFVLPNQNQPPLVMDSNASYQQSEGGTESTPPKQ